MKAIERIPARFAARVLSCSLALFLVGASAPSLFSQKIENTRKVLYKVAPKYPPELKRNAIGGVVRLSIVVTPRGTVEKISTLGGNPALADAATVAVKQWKYVPAEASTTTEVQIDFVPAH